MPQLQFILTAQDAGRARTFYERAFGAGTVWSVPDGTWSVMRVADRELCIEGNGTGEIVDTGFALEVADLEQTLTAVDQAGGRVYRPQGADLAVVTDTEGNRLTVVGPGGCSMHASKFPEPTATDSRD